MRGRSKERTHSRKLKDKKMKKMRKKMRRRSKERTHSRKLKDIRTYSRKLKDVLKAENTV